MKRVLIITDLKKAITKALVLASLLLLFFITGQLYAQSDSAAAEEPEEEESLLISPSLSFFTIQKGNNTIDFKAALNAKINGANKKLPHLRVTFVQVMGEEEKTLGFAITDISGKATFNCKAELVTPDKEGNLNLKAIFAGNKAMEATEEEVTIKRARLEISPVKGDSLNSVEVKLVDLATGAETPVPETALGIFVQRYFNPLKIAEATTDEAGEATAEIPGDLLGDENGNIVLLVKLDEHELYGNVEASIAQKWGIPVSQKINKLPRSLWSHSPPIWMLITFIILITVVWGHYFVIIFELFRLRKEEPHQPAN
jgi:hypothetical protein